MAHEPKHTQQEREVRRVPSSKRSFLTFIIVERFRGDSERWLSDLPTRAADVAAAQTDEGPPRPRKEDPKEDPPQRPLVKPASNVFSQSPRSTNMRILLIPDLEPDLHNTIHAAGPYK